MEITELLVRRGDLPAITAATRNASPGAGEVLLRSAEASGLADNLTRQRCGLIGSDHNRFRMLLRDGPCL